MKKRNALPVKLEIRASEDLDAIFKFISEKSPQNAVHVVNNLIDLADSLGEFPEKFVSLESISKNTNRNYRTVSKWSFKIVFEVTDNAVWIMQIFNNSKHPDKLIRRLKF